jgi:hypothetical protein
MKTTNIYYIVDASIKTRGDTANRIKQNITKVARALQFCPYKTKLHIIGYRDKAFFIHPFNAYMPYGNADFGEGLKMLENVMNYGNPDRYTKRAYYRFAEAPDKILRHFSDGRLCSLIRTIQTH